MWNRDRSDRLLAECQVTGAVQTGIAYWVNGRLGRLPDLNLMYTPDDAQASLYLTTLDINRRPEGTERTDEEILYLKQAIIVIVTKPRNYNA